jgi:hypothetical protein
MYRSFISGIVASTLGVASVVPVTGQPLCRPTLNVTGVQFSEMIPPTRIRNWTAVVSVDASSCVANSTGYFEIVFTQLSETAPDLDFRERFTWSPPAVKVAVDFSADQAVERYRVENITPCACRD